MAQDGRRALGARGEQLAEHFLTGRGYQIVRRNWRCAAGELDLVALHGECLVFVEVRSRRGHDLGPPEESIMPAKQARLIRLAEAYVQAVDWQGDWRIDVVAIELDRQRRLLRLDHYENAVTG
jgi:putative endonuclease